jgi:hypothetical protein
MKYEVTYSCGHTDTVQLYGPNKDRERKLEWLKDRLCPACYKKLQEAQREAKVKEAIAEAKESGLPELVGSEKQVSWALEIRHNMLDGMSNANIIPAEYEILHAFVVKITDAKWWIEHRGFDYYDIAAYIREHPGLISDNTEAAKEAMEDDTLYPGEQKTKETAELIEAIDRVEIISQRDQIIIDTVKAHGCRWDNNKRVWYHPLGVVSGKAADRIAEIGNALLAAGVPVIIHDEDIRRNAVSGSFEPKHLRWVLSADDGKVRIYWAYTEDNLYQKARQLPYAKYKEGAIYVSAKYYAEIKDFAKLYDFKFSDKAEAELAAAEEKDKSVSRVVPEAVAKSDAGKKDGLQDILTSSRDIIDDLKDDD